MITIDAQNKVFGRVASAIARQLMGKESPTYRRHMVPDAQVKVINVSKISLRPGKALKTSYVRYSGYPGGLKHETMAHVIETKGMSEVLRKAVYGMLPGNRLRPVMMKNLILED
ncbi:MAG: uL13 family ribosomal protein [Patescibacteria group bacterium]